MNLRVECCAATVVARAPDFAGKQWTEVIDHRASYVRLLAARLATFLSGNADDMHLPWAAHADISILLVAFNQAELPSAVSSLLLAVLTGSHVRAEIILVDNASTDRTIELSGANQLRSLSSATAATDISCVGSHRQRPLLADATSSCLTMMRS